MSQHEFNLADLGTIYDGPHATPKRMTRGPFFLNIASLQNGRLDLDRSDHVSDADYVAWTRRVTPRFGDLLFSYETRLGNAAIMPENIRACLGRRMALLRPDKSRVDPRWLLYYYLSPGFQALIEHNTVHGATVNRISLSTMGSWKVLVPALREQRLIAEVLGVLDDKIAAEGRVASSAEELASALVSASARERAALADIACQRKPIVSPDQMTSKNVWHYSLPAYDEGRRPVFERPADIKSAKLRVDSPAVLISRLNPRFPRVWDVPKIRAGVSVASTEFLVLEPQSGSTGVLAAALLQKDFLSAVDAKVAGTSGSHQRVRPDDLMRTPVLDTRTIPTERADAATALMLRAEQAREESAVLADLRDVLLPELMSGRLRVRDAEEQVEEVL